MKQIKRIFVVSSLAFLLAGCHLLGNSQKTEVKPPVDVNQPDDTGVIEMPPEIAKQTDWNSVLSPFIKKLVNVPLSNSDNKLIFISDIQNRSGDYIANNQIDEALHQLMHKQNTFTVVDRQTISQAKQSLGISADDKLVSRGKMIGLAKSINASYVLFTTIYKVPSASNDVDLAMELISTQSGEILTRVASKDFPKQPDINKETNKVIEDNK
ncbi:hypothetical protein GYW75_08740 [Gilliamella sp. ESL0232]|uniref:penicillin-binding protein activator LpoB n=1 Tax=unclassified Gilliamella TaxID=2685620 RepID=UPI00158005F0|nr:MULTISPECIES: hypothetical protein [unclassified Gilliamella]MCO6550207.1 hypothetical protein [Gilliamella sp.]MCO6556790.1 hypothetical protein [Gilliamella sp.]NUE96465.1 hypothetical protein [Gilliamella sp. ESL0232]